MSHIGKNIRKIRKVKNLNQTQFAELFDLKRPSIGAYEEGRAEPKISTITQIANYFGISLDDLLNKELSVNDLYHFDIFKKDFVKNKAHQLRPSKVVTDFRQVLYVSRDRRSDFFSQASQADFPKIELPLPRIQGEYLAFEPSQGLWWQNEQGQILSLLVVRSISSEDLEAFLSKSVLLWEGGDFFFGRWEQQDESSFLRDYRHGERIYPGSEARFFLSLYQLTSV